MEGFLEVLKDTAYSRHKLIRIQGYVFVNMRELDFGVFYTFCIRSAFFLQWWAQSRRVRSVAQNRVGIRPAGYTLHRAESCSRVR